MTTIPDVLGGCGTSFTEEQRALLAQFELRPITASGDTPVVWVHSSTMRGGEETSSTSSSCLSVDTGNRDVEKLFGQYQPRQEERHHDGVEEQTAEGSESDDALALRQHLATSAADTHGERANAYLETSAAYKGGEEPSEGGVDDFHALYVENIRPLFHGQPQAASTSAPHIRKLTSAPPPATAVGPVEEAAKEGVSLDERCQELADRLLQMSADADAFALHMDHTVLPPSEFV